MRRGARAALKLVFDGIRDLRNVYGDAFEQPERKFTIDGRLVGDIGEAIAAVDYGVKLHKNQKEGTDGTFGRNATGVQVKATFQDKITFTKAPAPDIIVLCFKLYEDGRYTEAYNGPSEPLLREFWGRGDDKQRRPSVDDLLKMAAKVRTAQRIPRVRASR